MTLLAMVELLLATLLYPLRHAARTVARHLVVVRIPVLIVVIAGALYSVPQIRELFSVSVAAVDAHGSVVHARVAKEGQWELFTIWLSTALLGFSVWHSTRTLLRFNLVRGDEIVWGPPNPLFQTWAPRVLGAAIPLLVAGGFLGANGSGARWWCAFAAFGGGVSVALVTAFRRPLLHMQSVVREGAAVDRDWSDAPKRTWIISVTMFVLVNALALWPSNAAMAAQYCGPLPSLMLLAALFVMATSPLVFQATRKRVMIFALLLVWACGLQDIGRDWVDNHRISLASSDRTASPDSAIALDDYLARWPRCERAYFVSAEGGGIRAAAWTALVLARLDRELGDHVFGDCLVGASGVSGGSLGLAAFVAGRQALRPGMPAGADNNCTGPADDTAIADELECRLAWMMTRDFITPTLVAMFTTDQLQRLLPTAQWVRLPDRGVALETAFARAFNLAFPGADGNGTDSAFGKAFAFSDLYRSAPPSAKPRWTPVLLLNSTEVHTGRRVIQSGLEIPFDNEGASVDFPAARILNAWTAPHEVSLIGAVHNSARFTYISPAGTVRAGSTNTPPVQLVDGGYFENSGATTLLDLVRLFRMKHPNIPAVVIHISNDGQAVSRDDRLGVLPDTCPTAPAAHINATDSERPFGEILPPPYALYMTREARGEYARKALQREVPSTDFAWMRLYEHAGGYPLPLGWRIGDCAMCEMIAQFHADANRSQLVNATLVRNRDTHLPFVATENCKFSGTIAMMR